MKMEVHMTNWIVRLGLVLGVVLRGWMEVWGQRNGVIKLDVWGPLRVPYTYISGELNWRLSIEHESSLAFLPKRMSLNTDFTYWYYERSSDLPEYIYQYLNRFGLSVGPRYYLISFKPSEYQHEGIYGEVRYAVAYYRIEASPAAIDQPREIVNKIFQGPVFRGGIHYKISPRFSLDFAGEILSVFQLSHSFRTWAGLFELNIGYKII